MLTLSGVSLTLPDGRSLFRNLSFTLDTREKAALVGNNGVGKSTLFRILAGQLPAEGVVAIAHAAHYVPQLFGQFDHLTVAQVLGIDTRLQALGEVLNGRATDHYLSLIDDWSLEERAAEALQYWHLENTIMHQPLARLSGGEKTKAFLAGLIIHQPKFILLDEPTNHLDTTSRQILYNYISQSSATMFIISHDRALLDLLNPVFELSAKGINRYGGNYTFYVDQKDISTEALVRQVKDKEKTLRKAREQERETIQRQQKLDARGKGKQEKSGLPKIVQNALKNSAERSTAKIKDVHANKIAGIAATLQDLRKTMPDAGVMKLNIDNARLHAGKVLVEATGINLHYGKTLWTNDIDLRITSGERIAVKGSNGSGKTSLIKILLGQMNPHVGNVRRSEITALCIDQEYSLIDGSRTVREQAHTFNESELEAHEVNIRLNRFLFPKDTWDKPCHLLSGGERMRLMLCCLSIAHRTPDIIVLDEPTNNLDIQSAEILARAINEYRGTLIVISHDEPFLRDVKIERAIVLS